MVFFGYLAPMKNSLPFFFCLISFLLSCEKPSQGYVWIQPPTAPQQSTPTPPDPGPDPVPDPAPATEPDGFIVVGYATYWDKTMPDPSLLTHINYAFAHIKDDFETLDIKTPTRLSKIAGLKRTNPDLKVLLSIGGWEAGNFSEMAADAAHRKVFCENCVAAVRKYDLDGIDLDWEYPTSSMAGISSSPEDTKNFTLLLKDLRVALGDDKLLTMASAANAKYVDFKSAIQYLNFVNIMTYDMGNPPYHNAGLHPSTHTQLSCEESVSKHFDKGVPYSKMVLGIPFYGHGDGKAFDSYIDYRDFSYDPKRYSVRWDSSAQVPYLTDASGSFVFSYDDEVSVGLKADFVKTNGLKGAMYWNIEADDATWTLSKAVASRLLEGAVPEDEAVLVTNPYVQTYLEQVTYKDWDFSYSLIKNYPGGGPGEADIPPSVTIEWTADATAGPLTLRLWDDEWSREYDLKAGTSSLSVSNLVPGSHYSYQVFGGDGTLLSRGTFRTRGALHQVYFTGKVRNGRDLGGWKTEDGKTVRFRKLYRGGRVDGKYMDGSGRAEALAVGIRAELDLREAEDVPSVSQFGSECTFCAPGFENGYRSMLRDRAPGIKECFEFIVKNLRAGRPVYFHCAAGRDRTGTIAMVVLGVLGVPERDIAKDYELTYFSPADWSMYKGDYHHMRTAEGSYVAAMEYLWKAGTSGSFKDRVESYLLSIGVAQKDIDDLRTIMLK